jgi:PIN domain nuclease of toxin-antitoxin system
MRTARSARAGVALGATLIACSLAGIANAEQTSSSAYGISVGDTQGISVGDTAGISVGDTAGISVGDAQGISVGDTNGISVGDTQGISVGDTAGISVGDIQGISVGDVAGISVGDAQGISVGDTAGISVGDILGISVGDVAGISVGDAQGISVGDIAGISVGDVHGISVGDVSGISVGDAQGISVGDTAGISVGDIQGISVGDSSVLAGPVERIDIINGVFHSMGQVVMASKSMLSAMRVGDFVTVDGSVVSPGWLYADAISVSDISYVPGATKVFVSGMLTAIDVVNGTARMGGLMIDYTATLGNGLAPSGSMWSFEGTRPQSGGVMVSDRSGSIR